MTFAVAASLVFAACSSEPDGARLPDGSDAIIVDEVVGLTAAPSAVWGDGRALDAVPIDDDTTAVVTTTGVYLAARDGSLTDLDLFGSETQVGPSAVSDDGSTLAVTTLAPSIVRWYDLADRRFVGADELALGVDVVDLGFLAGTTDLVAVTSTGIATWPTGPVGGAAAPLGEAVNLGPSAFLPDGRIAVPLIDTGEIAFVGSDDVERITVRLPENGVLLGARSSPDGSTLGVASGVGPDDFERTDSIAIIDAASDERLGEVTLERPLQPDRWIVTDSGVAVAVDTTLTWWSHSGEQLSTTEAPTDQPIVELLAWGDGLVSVHQAGALVSWVTDGAAPEPRLLDGGGIAIEQAHVDAARDAIVTIDFYGRIKTVDLLADPAPVPDDRFAVGSATSVAVSADDSNVAVGASNGRVALLESDLAETWAFDVGDTPARVDAVEFNPSTGLLTSGLAERLGELAFDDTVTTWDPGDRAAVFSLGGESEDVAGCSFFYNRIRFTPDGTLMAATSHDFSVALVDAASGELVHRFPPQPSTVLDLAFSADGELLVASSDSGTVTVWNVADRSVAATYDAALGGYQAIAVMPNDNVMATVDVTGTLALIDILTGQNVLTFDGTASRTASLALSSDGALLAAPAENSTVAVWSTDSGLRLAELTGHTAPVSDLAFSSDGRWLVTSSADGTVRQWTLDATT